LFAVFAFFTVACGSPAQEDNGSAGSGGGGISPHGGKPSAEQIGGCEGSIIQDCTRFTYNDKGDVVKSEECYKVTCQQWCDSPATTTHAYEYDAQGRIAKVTSYLPVPGQGPQCISFAYDDHNNWIKATPCAYPDGDGQCRDLTYDSQGRIQTELGYNCNAKEAADCSKYSYDDQDRIVQTKLSKPSCSDPDYACYKSVYDGDTVTYYSGDSNCGNQHPESCTV
jgi:hypothetical protein